MRTRYLISALAVVGLIACAAAASASASSTPTMRTERQSASSANWSGYVAGGANGSSTQFSSVSGSWTEPSASCSAGQGYSSFWVGLGGAGGQSQALEQVGTEADCGSTGSASHFAWYELVPSAPVRLDLTISAGDHLTGKVTVNGTNVTVSLSDNTTGASATKTLQMSNPDVSSAEWIAEAPSSCDGSGNCQPLPLADFGNVSFTNATATANGHTGPISDPNWTSQAVQLDGGASDGTGFVSDQSTAGATPSGLSSDGSSFSVAWASAGAQPQGSGSSAGAGNGGDPYGGGSPDGSGAGSAYGGGGGYGDGGGYGYSAGGGYGYSAGGGYGYGYGVLGF